MIAGIPHKLESEQNKNALRPNAAYSNSYIVVSYMPGAKKSKTVVEFS